MKFAPIVMLTVATAFVTPVLAGDGPGRAAHPGFHKAMMAELDTNKDGTISDEERAAYREAKFKAADANNDGVLTKEELRAYDEKQREIRRQKMEDARFARLDANGDGKVTAEEYKAAAARQAEFRKKHDGKRKWHKKPEAAAPAGEAR